MREVRIKPHNLCRHTLPTALVRVPKAVVPDCRLSYDTTPYRCTCKGMSLLIECSSECLSQVPGITEILLLGFYQQHELEAHLEQMRREYTHVHLRYLQVGDLVTWKSEMNSHAGVHLTRHCRWRLSLQKSGAFRYSRHVISSIRLQRNHCRQSQSYLHRQR